MPATFIVLFTPLQAALHVLPTDAHTALQLVKPVVHALSVPHLPPRHDPAVQTLPHVPQFFGSTWVALQTPLHTIWFVGQLQVLWLHVAPVGQALPHMPQFCASADMSLQAPPQAPSPLHASVRVIDFV